MTHHRMESLDVPNQEQSRRYAQLYFLDSSTQANETRMNHPHNSRLDEDLLRKIDLYIRENNHYTDIYRSTQEVIQEAEATQLGLTLLRYPPYMGRRYLRQDHKKLPLLILLP